MSKRSKKILIIIASIKLGGGAERVASQLVNGLHSIGYEVSLMTFYDYEYKYSIDIDEYCLHEKHEGGFIKNLIKFFKRILIIKSFCTKHSINTSISFMEEASIPLLLSKCFYNRSKTILSIRTSVDHMSNLYRNFIKLFYKYADLVVPNSKEQCSDLINKYKIPSRKITTIHNPLNLKLIDKLSTIKIDSIQKYLEDDDKFTFITVGRLSPEKNQKMIIKMFDKFSNTFSNCRLLILGEGETKDLLISQTKNLNIHFLGNQKNVFQFLKISDCFLFSSLWEGFPNAVMEAMACGLPIISTRFKSGITELLDSGGGYICESEESYIEAMEKVYVNRLIRNKLGREVLIKSQMYSLENTIKKWIELI